MRGHATTATKGTGFAFGGGDRVPAAALDAIAYADLFDWPLTLAEVHRDLPAVASVVDVRTALERCIRSGAVTRHGALHVLRGREQLVARRREREAASARLWPEAIRACRVLARLPWIRLVAVSGSLAVNAAEPDADIDLFMVVADGRLWLARALTIAAGKVTARGEGGRGTRLCPNYLVSTTALALPERDLFTAHELAHLVPLHGAETYRALMATNRWYRDFLPNHPGYTGAVAPLGGGAARFAVETVLGNRAVSHAEQWERERKIARLTTREPSAEVRF